MHGKTKKKESLLIHSSEVILNHFHRSWGRCRALGDLGVYLRISGHEINVQVENISDFSVGFCEMHLLFRDSTSGTQRHVQLDP